MADIFNREALEALDDHSEAEEMARVASPKVRIVIAAMVAMMVGLSIGASSAPSTTR